jgi:lysylphosphatidylglycerol synthetase-like protein (DUF2156 family)
VARLLLDTASDWRGLPYAVGLFVILIAALLVTVVSRNIKESRPERRQEDAEAAALIDRNAEAAGWGPPLQRHRS